MLNDSLPKSMIYSRAAANRRVGDLGKIPGRAGNFQTRIRLLYQLSAISHQPSAIKEKFFLSTSIRLIICLCEES
jgi:hypothetical protein